MPNLTRINALSVSLWQSIATPTTNRTTNGPLYERSCVCSKREQVTSDGRPAQFQFWLFRSLLVLRSSHHPLTRVLRRPGAQPSFFNRAEVCPLLIPTNKTRRNNDNPDHKASCNHNFSGVYITDRFA